MNLRLVLLCTVVALCGPAGTLGAQSRSWVVATVSGQERAAFVPQGEPYLSGGPAVAVPVPAGQLVRLPSGEAVEGFEFIGWHEGDALRVVVRALIPLDPREPPPALPKQDRVERRQVATLLLRPGTRVAVERMRQLGATPVELQVVER